MNLKNCPMEYERKAKVIQIQRYSSPCGGILLGSFEGRLCLCDWQIEERREAIDKRIQKALQARYEVGESGVIVRAVAQLDEYFDRRRTEFDVPLLFVGTDFQKMVWEELRRIPYGATESYAGLSRRFGNPKAIRAVAAANGANPISIFVPCHRVIGSDRKLIGYGGGLPAKRLLLELESLSNSLF